MSDVFGLTFKAIKTKKNHTKAMVFLVFMALKVKPKTLAEFSKPFIWSYYGKKMYKKSFFCYLVFEVAFKIFFGLSHFFWDISCLRSPLGCSNPISKFNIIPNSKWFKFPISNHSVLQFAHLLLPCIERCIFQ